jgi:transcriptional regulator with XRE-family HTH domain
MSEIRKNIADIAEKDHSKWIEKARYRRENRNWLRKSKRIAVRVLSTLKEKGMSQTDLAEILDVSRQQISKIVKGKENLTLKTVAELENALGVVLLDIPETEVEMEIEASYSWPGAFEPKTEKNVTKRVKWPKSGRQKWDQSDNIYRYRKSA